MGLGVRIAHVGQEHQGLELEMGIASVAGMSQSPNHQRVLTTEPKKSLGGFGPSQPELGTASGWQVGVVDRLETVERCVRATVAHLHPGQRDLDGDPPSRHEHGFVGPSVFERDLRQGPALESE